MGRTRVLLIEDDEDSRELLAEILRSDYEIETAADGVEGLAVFERFLPDAVVTDESLPKLRGTELAARVKALRPQTRVVLVTGYGNLAPTEACDLLLKKPLDVEALSSALRSFFPNDQGAHA